MWLLCLNSMFVCISLGAGEGHKAAKNKVLEERVAGIAKVSVLPSVSVVFLTAMGEMRECTFDLLILQSIFCLLFPGGGIEQAADKV